VWQAPGKPLADKVVHFLEDKLRTKDSVVDKLTLKNAALKQQVCAAYKWLFWMSIDPINGCVDA
jgi:hypothetical protein